MRVHRVNLVPYYYQNYLFFETACVPESKLYYCGENWLKYVHMLLWLIHS